MLYSPLHFLTSSYCQAFRGICVRSYISSYLIAIFQSCSLSVWDYLFKLYIPEVIKIAHIQMFMTKWCRYTPKIFWGSHLNHLFRNMYIMLGWNKSHALPSTKVLCTHFFTKAPGITSIISERVQRHWMYCIRISNSKPDKKIIDAYIIGIKSLNKIKYIKPVVVQPQIQYKLNNIVNGKKCNFPAPFCEWWVL